MHSSLHVSIVSAAVAWAFLLVSRGQGEMSLLTNDAEAMETYDRE